MDNTHILRSGLRILRRHKYFIFLTWLAGEGGAGFNANFQGRVTLPRNGSESRSQADQLGRWVTDHIGLLITIGVLFLAIGIALWVIGRVATGALYWASANATPERRIAFRQAWGAGRGSFGRLITLDLAIFGVVLLCVFLLVILVAVGIAAPVFFLLAVPLFLGFFAAALTLLIPVAWARRALVIDELRPKAAFRAGWQLFRGNVRESLVFGLMMWAIRFGVSIAIGMLLAALAIPVIIPIVNWISNGDVPNWGFVIPYATVLLVLSVILGACYGAYASVCWTLGFLELKNPRPVMPAGLWTLSPDGMWYWDGGSWRPCPPPGAPVSPDGLWWWNGVGWVPRISPPPPAGG